MTLSTKGPIEGADERLCWSPRIPPTRHTILVERKAFLVLSDDVLMEEVTL